MTTKTRLITKNHMNKADILRILEKFCRERLYLWENKERASASTKVVAFVMAKKNSYDNLVSLAIIHPCQLLTLFGGSLPFILVSEDAKSITTWKPKIFLLFTCITFAGMITKTRKGEPLEKYRLQIPFDSYIFISTINYLSHFGLAQYGKFKQQNMVNIPTMQELFANCC